MNLEQYAFNKFINNNTVVYDIGAHIGDLSILAHNLGAKEVHAFEPSDFNIKELISNTSNYNNIIVHHIALHEKSYECKTRFKDCADSRIGIPLDTEQNIKYAVLEEYIKSNNINLPDFIKIDIEGMESIVFKTLDFLFKEKRPVIYTEIHAAEKGQIHQNYPNNPHWKWPDEGGFDFNTLISYNYCMMDPSGNTKYVENFNPDPKTHSGRLFIPKELL